ncbi:hypothetical protein [Anaerolentibacter hominis]|uniref:hypothetical protein n=1 Tax=Anaerolentibacter hominis TaxID=3079009 RepID=UPI0031B7F3D2
MDRSEKIRLAREGIQEPGIRRSDTGHLPEVPYAKRLLLRFVCAAVLFLCAWGGARFLPADGPVTETKVREVIAYNETFDSLEEKIAAFANTKIIPVFQKLNGSGETKE